jgi:hypothetical protein
MPNFFISPRPALTQLPLGYRVIASAWQQVIRTAEDALPRHVGT